MHLKSLLWPGYYTSVTTHSGSIHRTGSFLNLAFSLICLTPYRLGDQRIFLVIFPAAQSLLWSLSAISKRSGACQSLDYLESASNACVLPWIVIPVLPHVFVIVFVFPIFTTTSMHFPKLRHCPTIASKTRNMKMHSMSQG